MDVRPRGVLRVPPCVHDRAPPDTPRPQEAPLRRLARVGNARPRNAGLLWVLRRGSAGLDQGWSMGALGLLCRTVPLDAVVHRRLG